jgi:hypothetical protein
MSGILNSEVHFKYQSRTNETRSRKIYISTDMRVVYIRKGKAVWKIGKVIYNVKGGCLLLLNNTVPRIIVEIDPDCPPGIHDSGYQSPLSVPHWFSPFVYGDERRFPGC